MKSFMKDLVTWLQGSQGVCIGLAGGLIRGFHAFRSSLVKRKGYGKNKGECEHAERIGQREARYAKNADTE